MQVVRKEDSKLLEFILTHIISDNLITWGNCVPQGSEQYCPL